MASIYLARAPLEEMLLDMAHTARAFILKAAAHCTVGSLYLYNHTAHPCNPLTCHTVETGALCSTDHAAAVTETQGCLVQAFCYAQGTAYREGASLSAAPPSIVLRLRQCVARSRPGAHTPPLLQRTQAQSRSDSCSDRVH